MRLYTGNQPGAKVSRVFFPGSRERKNHGITTVRLRNYRVMDRTFPKK